MTCLAMVEFMLGKESKDFISKVPLSNNAISCRIIEMSDGINNNVIEKIKINYFR